MSRSSHRLLLVVFALLMVALTAAPALAAPTFTVLNHSLDYSGIGTPPISILEGAYDVNSGAPYTTSAWFSITPSSDAYFNISNVTFNGVLVGSSGAVLPVAIGDPEDSITVSLTGTAGTLLAGHTYSYLLNVWTNNPLDPGLVNDGITTVKLTGVKLGSTWYAPVSTIQTGIGVSDAPEPSSLFLLPGGLLGLISLRRLFA